MSSAASEPSEGLADRCDRLLEELFPICRSLTGAGNRLTLEKIRACIPIEIHEFPSGMEVFDWVIPPEWNIRDAYVMAEDGTKIIDFAQSNLSVLNYSAPIDRRLSWSDIRSHVHTLEDQPSAIPYRTSYYERQWGFCAPYEAIKHIDDNEVFHCFIDSSFDPTGGMQVADLLIPGRTSEEVLISTYFCHPSMANDNLSGVILTTLLAAHLLERDNYYTYRVVFVPETIGAIAYLARWQEEMRRVIGGAVVATVGGPGDFSLKSSFSGQTLFDRSARYVLASSELEYRVLPFTPDGSDERQYASPGFRIPTITIAKDQYYSYPEYHTSLDDLGFVETKNILQTYGLYKKWVDVIEINRVYSRTDPYCEFHLGSRGLYPKGYSGGEPRRTRKGDVEENREDLAANEIYRDDLEAIGWLMHLCDGNMDCLEIAERTGCSFERIVQLAVRFEGEGLLEVVR